MPRKQRSFSERVIEFYVNGPLSEVEATLHSGNAIFKARNGGMVTPPPPAKPKVKKAKPAAGAAEQGPGQVSQVG